MNLIEPLQLRINSLLLIAHEASSSTNSINPSFISLNQSLLDVQYEAEELSTYIDTEFADLDRAKLSLASLDAQGKKLTMLIELIDPKFFQTATAPEITAEDNTLVTANPDLKKSQLQELSSDEFSSVPKYLGNFICKVLVW